MNREFKQRYVFTGDLTLTTGLHIGGGQTIFSVSDSPVIRTPDGKPFIPGSSFKGAFRSTVEKLTPLAGLWSCGLTDAPVMIDGKEKRCIGVQGDTQREFNQARNDATWTETQLIEKLTTLLCATCQLFGSPYAASKISFSDLYLPADEEAEGVIQIRDGVAIDRDSERAVDNLLYNYEVVAPELTFQLKITLEDPADTDLRLTCLGLAEFQSGYATIGGKRSRGLGQCRLDNLTGHRLDLRDKDTAAARLLNYLVNKEMEPLPGDFINEQIRELLEGQSHA